MKQRLHRKTPFVRIDNRPRDRATGEFAEKFSNAKCALVGYLTGKGLTSRRISKILNDGTKPSTIRKMWNYWKLPALKIEGRGMEEICVPFSSRERESICSAAESLNITPETFIRRVAYFVARDNMYDAVIDEREVD